MLEWARMRKAVVTGFWLAVGDVLWTIPGWRERYYFYKERAWKNAHTAETFPEWLKSGGWKNGRP